jgi:hypothetical protein
MFGSCPCVQARDGIFVLAACIYAALWWPVFFGTDFGPLLAAFLAAPLDPSIPFALWGTVVVAGLVLLVGGIRENLQDGHGAPVLSSLAVIFACAVAMHHGWYLPRRVEWGLVGMHISRGFYVASIAACCANLGMAYAARVRRLRRAAPRHVHQAHGATGDAENREMKARLAERAAELERLAAENSEMKAVLTFPGLRAVLYHTLHSDHHAAADAGERSARDEAVARLTAIYKRIGIPRDDRRAR